MKTFNLALAIAFIFTSLNVYPCTSVFFDGRFEPLVGKNQDWFQGNGAVFINKRDVQKTAIFVKNPLTWTSKYMSATFTQSGREFPWEGMNERGVSVTIMWLDSTVLPPTTDSRPAINGLQFIQYLLDTSASTDQAIAHALGTRVEGPVADKVHYFVCDITKKCATLEFIGGNLIFHTGIGLPFKALTNDTYEYSENTLRTNLKTSSALHILSSKSTRSSDRFARAAILSQKISQSLFPSVTYAFMTLHNVSAPANAESPTQWSIVFALKSKLIRWKTLQSPTLKYFDLKSFDPHCKAPVKMFDMNSKVTGDANAAFVDYTPEANKALANLQKLQPQKFIDVSTSYPASTKCLE